MGISVTRRQLEYEWDGTYWHPTLPVRILGPFRCVAMAVRNNGRGFHDVILDAGNDGVGVRGIAVNGWNGWVCSCWERLFGTEG